MFGAGRLTSSNPTLFLSMILLISVKLLSSNPALESPAILPDKSKEELLKP